MTKNETHVAFLLDVKLVTVKMLNHALLKFSIDTYTHSQTITRNSSPAVNWNRTSKYYIRQLPFNLQRNYLCTYIDIYYYMLLQ